MSQPTTPNPAVAVPAKPLPDNNTGGIASTADAGLADALQRSSERGDDPATGLASTGNASSGGAAPRSDLGGKNEPGAAPGASGPASGEAAAQRRP